MENDHRNHDDAIDKTLAALKSAAPPQGMEERILHRLQLQPAPAAPFRWRDLFAGSALAAAWWRGALTGLTTAMLLVSALLLAQHTLRVRPGHTTLAVNHNSATRNPAPVVVPVAASAPNSPALANLCPTQLRHARTYRAETLTDASFAPSHPAPVLPLTAQERALVRLARTADPRLLAALSPETQARVEAQEADDYNKFFAPPPAPPTTDVNDENRTAPQQGEQI
jgi:hypothetical protein